MNKNNNILGYFKTILWTLAATFIFVVINLLVIEYQVGKEQPLKEAQDKIEESSIQVLMAKNEYLETINPKDYRVNLRLGKLYEIKNDYVKAEEQYKKSIMKVPFGEYKPKYYLALLYIMQNRLDEAKELIDKISEHPDKKLIKYKAEVHEKLGDAYFNLNNFDEASFEYSKSLFYYRSLKSKKIKRVEGSLASAYMYFADEKVLDMQIDEAISYLEMAKNLVNSPIIKYKLAVLLTNDNPARAYQYYDEVFKEAPEIINFPAYNKFLNDLAQQAQDVGEYAEADLYNYKIKKLKQYFSDKILCFDDLVIENPKGFFTLNFWKNKYHIRFNCKLKNVSTFDIKSLYVEIVFETKDKEIYAYSHQLFDDKSILKAGNLSPLISINTYPKIQEDDAIPSEITAKIYVSKLETSSKIFLKEITIGKKPKRKIVFKLFRLKFQIPFL